jgi:hypothetical protein
MPLNGLNALNIFGLQGMPSLRGLTQRLQQPQHQTVVQQPRGESGGAEGDPWAQIVADFPHLGGTLNPLYQKLGFDPAKVREALLMQWADIRGDELQRGQDPNAPDSFRNRYLGGGSDAYVMAVLNEGRFINEPIGTRLKRYAGNRLPPGTVENFILQFGPAQGNARGSAPQQQRFTGLQGFVPPQSLPGPQGFAQPSGFGGQFGFPGQQGFTGGSTGEQRLTGAQGLTGTPGSTLPLQEPLDQLRSQPSLQQLLRQLGTLRSR